MPPVHDYVISNGTGAAVRSDLNGALAAIVSNNSSASEPAPTYAYMWWADTTTGLLKQRNSANAAWITIGTLASTNLGLLSLAGGTLTGALLADDSGTVALPAIAFDGDTNTGIFRAGADQFNIATNGVERVEFGNTEVVFNDDGDDVDFRVEGDTNPDLFKIDAGLDQVQVANLNGGPLAGTRNRIINGDMRIDQRNAGAAVTTTSSYTVDRFVMFKDTAALGMSAQRVNEGPPGFTNSLKLTVTTAATTGTAEANSISHYIEGHNVSDLGFGTASAGSFTISFWVRSSATGTFGGGLGNDAANRWRAFSYVISSANTWEFKSVTIPADTTGTWLTDAGIGLRVYFSIGAGSSFSGSTSSWDTGTSVSATGATSITNTLNATWQITGVQLEPGTVATPFERRSYGQELALCQRYTRVIGDGINGVASNANAVYFNYTFDQPMRAAPTVTLTDTTLLISDQYFSDYTSTGSAIIGNNQSSIGGRTSINGFSGLTTGRFHAAYGNTNQSFLLLSAEL